MAEREYYKPFFLEPGSDSEDKNPKQNFLSDLTGKGRRRFPFGQKPLRIV